MLKFHHKSHPQSVEMQKSVTRRTADLETLDGPQRIPSDTVVTHDVLVMYGDPPIGRLPLGCLCVGTYNNAEGATQGIIIERPVTAGEFRAHRAAQRLEAAKRDADAKIKEDLRALQEVQTRQSRERDPKGPEARKLSRAWSLFK